jgi:hypothetical protein
MTPTERAFLARVHRRTTILTAEMAATILRAYRAIAEGLPESEIARLIASGVFDAFVSSVLTDAVLDLAFRPVQTTLRRTLEQSVTYVARDFPTKAGRIGVVFDVLNPNVLTAVRTLDDKILSTLKTDARESIRQAIQARLESGANPRSIARGIRDVVGLSPAQELAVRNYRAELEAGKVGAASARQLHDARFSMKNLTAEKIDRMVASYRTKMTAYHAETIARTATLDAFKRAQTLAWQQAIDDGIVDGDRLMKQWMQVQRPTKRDSHIPLNGEIVAFDQPYSNGQQIPGEGEFNCACLSRVFLARAA